MRNVTAGLDQKPRNAVKQIGTNAVPFLLRWIQYETPKWRRPLGAMASILPTFIEDTRCVQWIVKDKSEERAEMAMLAFEILGSDGTSAVPELQRMADNPKAPETAIRATQCLILMTQRFPGIDLPTR
jgi:hypothetical protein